MPLISPVGRLWNSRDPPASTSPTLGCKHTLVGFYPWVLGIKHGSSLFHSKPFTHDVTSSAICLFIFWDRVCDYPRLARAPTLGSQR